MRKSQTKVYMYTRVSTAMQTDGYSLEAQESAIKKYAEYAEMQICGSYSDEGYSGKNIEGRLQFRRMLDDIAIKKDGVKYVLVYKLSRFGRNAADVLSSLQFMQDFGVNLICVEDHIDSSTDSGKMLISVMSAMAEIERENILAQTMAGRQQKAREGGWNGGFAPYGYELINGQLSVVEGEAVAIRKIYDLFVHTDLGAQGVAKELNKIGMKKVIRHNGKYDSFTRNFVLDVLDNPVYMGKIAFGRRTTVPITGMHNVYHTVKETDTSKIIISEGKQEAIVSEEIWNLAETKRKETGFKKESRNKDHEYILSSLVKCPKCGRSMYGVKSANKKRADGTLYPPSYAYICRQRKENRGFDCEFKRQINARILDGEVENIILSLVNTSDFAMAVKGIIDEQIDTEELNGILNGQKAKKRKTEQLQNKLEMELDSLDMDSPTYDRRYESINRRLDATFTTLDEIEESIEATNARIQKAQEEKLSRDMVYQYLLAFDKLYVKMTDAEKKRFMQTMIKSIDLFPEKQKDGHWIKMIHFRFPIFYNNQMVTEISLPNQSTVESIVCLVRK